MADVEGFVNICVSYSIDFAILSYDYHLDMNAVSDMTLRMMKVMTDGLEKNGILYADYSGLTKTKRYIELSLQKDSYYG